MIQRRWRQLSGGPLRLGLAARLVAVLLAAAVALSAVVVVTAEHANQLSARQQLDDAAVFVAQRVRAVEAGWLLQADVLRAQVEFERLLDTPDPALRHARLSAFMAILGGEGTFTHAALVDRASGEVIYRYRTRSQQDLAPPRDDGAALSWVFGERDATVYRAISQKVLIAGRPGRLVLFVPIDNALLAANRHPDAIVGLRWRGQLVAHSGDTPSDASVFEGRPSVALRQGRWADDAEGPELLILRHITQPLGIAQTLSVVALGALAVALLGWLVLGRWLSRQAHGLVELQAATAQFTAAQKMTPEIATALDGAAQGVAQEIASLAHEARAMMDEVEKSQLSQQQTQQALGELNAELEDRVMRRTHDLALARDEAIAATRSKEQFLANMSHELRTPLSGMLGSLEMLDGAALPPQHGEMLHIAQSSGQALLRIINELLDFSKIEAGRLELAREPFAPAELLSEVVQLFWASASRKGVLLQSESSIEPGLLVLGDRMRLKQVLLNLTGNALKFTDHGGVSLRVLATATTTDRPLRLRFEVQDSGIGIDPADQRLVFLPFVQAGSAASRSQRGGTGLGLAISQRLVDAMGGTLALSSEIGQGTLFHFEIELAVTRSRDGVAPAVPRLQAAPHDGPGRIALALPALSGSVLLVDDNLVNRIVAAEMLARLGLRVVECDNGGQACDLIESQAFDVVLMDCMMPVLDGFDATRRIRERESRSGAERVPIVALTANALHGDAQRCIAAGMDGYLTKPFTLAQLAAALLPWLGATPSCASAGA
ncbi:MAG TPA: response regulator [Albitalea sp.]|nr:response regulator [Albitalea sp.]